MITVYSGIDAITVEAEAALEVQLLQEPFLHQYIPQCAVRTGQQAQSKLTIVYGEAVALTYGPAQFVLTLPKSSEIDVKGVITVIDYCLEYIRQQAGRYTIHGSAAERGGRAVLCIGGASGIGKTTVIFKLIDSHGFTLIGDDRIIIEGNSLVGGITAVQFNKPGLQQSISATLQRHVSDNGLAIHKHAAPLACIVQPVVVPHGSLEYEEWSRQKASFHLYEELSRKIRGVSRRIQQFTEPLQSLDDIHMAKKRSQQADLLAQSTTCCSIYGDAAAVAQKIVDLFVTFER